MGDRKVCGFSHLLLEDGLLNVMHFSSNRGSRTANRLKGVGDASFDAGGQDCLLQCR
jgi:hypothetical protein